ncbi:hypothetical protein ABIA39_003254 [Nocardia sp. GAS34]
MPQRIHDEVRSHLLANEATMVARLEVIATVR